MSELHSVIAGLLNCQLASLSPTSALGETPGWDSFAQLNIMLELERRYAIPITDDTIRAYSNLPAITALARERATS